MSATTWVHTQMRNDQQPAPFNLCSWLMISRWDPPIVLPPPGGKPATPQTAGFPCFSQLKLAICLIVVILCIPGCFFPVFFCFFFLRLCWLQRPLFDSCQTGKWIVGNGKDMQGRDMERVKGGSLCSVRTD